MQVDTMKLDPRIAAIYYKDYRKKVREHQQARLKKGVLKKSEVEKEDEVFKATYRALSQGHTLLNLATVLGEGGLDDNGLPALAVARADWTTCFLQTDSDRVVFSPESWTSWSWKAKRYQQPAVWFRQSIFPREFWHHQARADAKYPAVGRRKAIVPSIPALLRPEGDLDKYHILWEAVWEPAPPVDPILLRHIAGHMYAVLAQWDLTPLERSVIEKRIT